MTAKDDAIAAARAAYVIEVNTITVNYDASHSTAEPPADPRKAAYDAELIAAEQKMKDAITEANKL